MQIQIGTQFGSGKVQKRTRVYVSTDLPSDGVSPRRQVAELRALAVEALDKLELDGRSVLPSTGLTWNRNAGCSCGCSPGFLADGLLQVDGEWVSDLWVTVEQYAPTRETFERAFEDALAQL